MPVKAEFEVVDSVLGTVEAVGDAWSWMVLGEAIMDSTTRFDGFQGRLGIARQTLSGRLSSLCAAGLMGRDGRRYVLTAKGADFFGCVMTALAWADRWGGGGRGVAHVGCARRIRAELRCGGCHGVVRAREVSFDRRPELSGAGAGTQRRRRAPDLDLLWRAHPSSIATTLQVVGDHWSALLIRECFFGSRRFDDFQQRLGIASNILAHRLRRLAEHGVLARTLYQQRPLRHEYRLTEKGLALYPVWLAMLAWGDRWVANGKAPVALTHTPCGARLTPVLSCSVCTQPITREQVSFDPQ